jgi:hypothetical protein
MTKPPALSASQHSARGPVYWLVFSVLGLLTLYMTFWICVLVAIIGWDARITVFGADIYNAVQTAEPYMITLMIITDTLFVASFTLIALRRRSALIVMVLTVAVHLALFLSLIGNPYYSGGPGYILLPIEVVLIALLVLLVRRGVLR